MKKIIKNYKKIPIFLSLIYKNNLNYIKETISYLNYPINIDKVNFQDLYTNVHKDAAPIFILSTGRTGTALLTKILNTIPDIKAKHSFEIELLHYSKRAFKENNKSSEILSSIIDSNRYEYIRDAYLRGILFIDTSVYATFFATQLEKLYPKAKFIHLIRHPGGFIKSGIRRKWYLNNSLYEEGYLIPPNYIKRQIEKIAWLWYSTNNFIESFKNKINKDKILTIKFEDFVKDSEVTKNILSFIGKPNSINKKEIEKLIKKPINAQKEGKFPDYKDWNNKDKNILLNYKKLINNYGYKL